MHEYLSLCRRILSEGKVKGDRTGTGTISVFGHQMRFNLQDGFPAMTTKKLHMKSIIHELLWLLSGSTNTKYMKDNGVTIWNEWEDENGELGPVYGKQWRSWEAYEPVSNNYLLNTSTGAITAKFRHTTIDQISEVIQQIKTNPDSRRLLVSAWNVAEIKQMKLPPCHYAFQFGVYDGKLSCMLNMRSVDVFLGMPFNIASYALLTMMVAQVTGLELGDLVVSTADTHIYLNHVDQVREQLMRYTKNLPKMVITPRDSIFDFVYEDFKLEGYDPHPAIKGAVSK